MGGDDKLAASLDGRPLLDHALYAVADARRIVVVGPERPTTYAVTWAREQPVGGGPVTAIRAGLTELGACDLVVILAGDLPFAGGAVPRLLSAITAERGASDGAIVVDDEGREQFLLGAYDGFALRRRLADMPGEGGSMRQLVASLRLLRIQVVGAESLDCDTPDELSRAQRLLTDAKQQRSAPS